VNVSDTDTHRSFNEYRARLGMPPLSFEDWAHRREDTGTKKISATEFIRSSLPGLPVPECSHT
jgi:hypothetical protein